MKKTKFIQRTVSCLLAAAMISTLASCDFPSKNHGDTGINQPKQIVNYFTSEIYSKPAELGYVESAFAKDGYIYLYGYKDNSSAETVSMFYDTKSGTTTDFSLDAIEAEYINNVNFFGDKALVTYTAKETYSSKMALVTSSGEVTADIESGNSYVIATGTDASGNIITLKEGYMGSSPEVKKCVYSADTLEEISSENLSDLLGLSGRDAYPSNAVFDADGTSYISVIEYDGDDYDQVTFRLVKISPDGSVAYDVELSGMGEATGGGMVFRRADGSLCVMATNDRSSFFIDEIDPATGDITAMHETDLDGESVNGMVYGPEGIEGADILYTNREGLWKLSIDTGKSEKMAEFGSDLPEGCADCYTVQVVDGSVYFYGQVYSDGSYTGFYKMDSDGNVIENINISADDNSNVQNIFVNNEGEIILLRQSYDFESDSQSYSLVTIDDDGNPVKTVSLADAVSDSTSYISKVYMAGDNMVAACEKYDRDTYESSYELVVIDADGNLRNTIALDDVNYVEGIVHSQTGDYVFYYGKKGSECARVDLETGVVTQTEFDIPMYASPMESDGNYDFCYKSDEGIYGYSIDEKKSTEIINYVDSDVPFNVQDAFFFDENTILTLGYDPSLGDYQVYFLKRADEDTLRKIQNKTLITVAGVDLSYGSLREKVVEFNKNSDEYRVQVNDYSKFSKFDEDDTYISGAFQLNSDMSSGNVPDVIVGNGDVDMTSFAAKKIITDLTPYIEKDEEINRDDYFDNVLSALSYNGRLCQITSDFTLSTLVGPASKIGETSGWSYDEFSALRNNGRVFWEREDRDYLLSSLIKSNLTEFVDFENKTCDFDNERFSGLIDLVAEEGYVYDEYDESENEKDDGTLYNTRYSSGNCQLSVINIGSFYELLELQQGAVNEPVSIKGFPSEKDCGVLIVPNTSFAICEKSGNKDAAWQFIREFLLKDYQDSLVEGDYSYRIPLMKSSYDVMINKALAGTGQRGYSVTKPDGSFDEMKPLDQDTADRITNAVSSAKRCVTSDERIGGIIDEAVEKVFNDEISSADAAAEIQSKVKTYLNEIK